MPVKKILTYLAIAFVAFYLLNNPTGAAGLVESAASGVVSAAESLSRFVTELTP
ncbi:hypothetical protein [Rhizohabitans arisaemae]|uniref:hypothetical protein n=1 Tax=Rhizohabitans arisaemae TaxID=2720610 RepID=UPI0024B14E86|nr:hypothetical protein [Rhizohabitans arisaemae]